MPWHAGEALVAEHAVVLEPEIVELIGRAGSPLAADAGFQSGFDALMYRPAGIGRAERIAVRVIQRQQLIL